MFANLDGPTASCHLSHGLTCSLSLGYWGAAQHQCCGLGLTAAVAISRAERELSPVCGHLRLPGPRLARIRSNIMIFYSMKTATTLRTLCILYILGSFRSTFRDFVRKCDGNIIYQIITTGNKRNDIIGHITSGDAFYLVLSHQMSDKGKCWSGPLRFIAKRNNMFDH